MIEQGTGVHDDEQGCAPGDCYWEINSDQNGGHTVANDTVTGGRPTVRLTAGQFFTTKGCGDWTTP